MKWVTFAVAFLLTTAIVIAGVVLYPEVFGQAATANNDYVFTLFLGPFFVVLFCSWLGEKLLLKILKKQ
jgi:hypothetical protein